MNLVTTRGFGHRLLRNNTVESAPFDGEKYGEWGAHSQEEMNLRGGDVAFIRGTLERMAQILPREYRTPFSNIEKKAEPAATEAL